MRAQLQPGVFGLLLTLLLSFPASALAWDASGGGDHGGQDWILADGAVVAGTHTNVGRLVIPAEVHVQVRAADGDQYGALEVHCCDLELLGQLNADAAGAPGGARAQEGGGHQGSGPGGGCGGGPGGCVAQGASGGGYGGVGGQPEQETNWNEPCGRCDNPVESHCSGPGGATYGTEAGEDVAMGSGGGASGNSCGCNGAGAVGGAGGGSVKLLVDATALIDGSITTNGETAALDDSDCGYHPGGGGGAGGGILVQAATIEGVGRLAASGGGGGEADGCPAGCGDWAWAGGGGGGGRIKLFSPDDRFGGVVVAAGGEGGPSAAGGSAFPGLPGAPGTISRSDASPFELPGCAGPPRIRLPDPLQVVEGTPLRIVAEGRDPDGGDLRWEWDLDGDEVFDDAQGPAVERLFDDDGDYPVAVRATDDEDEQAVAEGVVRVANVPPTISSQPPAEGTEGQLWEYRVRASDPAGDLDPLSVVLELAPEGMAADGLRVHWTPTAQEALVGFVLIRLAVQDDDGGEAQQAFRVELTWLDADADGMADSWEQAYGLDPADPADAHGDLDADGLTNLEEFLARSDPSRFGRPDAPMPLAPSDGAWVRTAQPALVVGNAADPDGDALRYSFEIASEPDFFEVGQRGEDVPEGAEQTSWTAPRPLRENTSYWWRARASDGTFLSEPSPAWRFTINAVPEAPALPTLQAPGDGLPVGTPRPTFEVVVGAGDPDGESVRLHWAVYADEQLETSAQEGWLDVAEVGPGATLSWSPEADLQEDETYHWRVELVDAGGMSSGLTAPWSFKVNQDNGAPPAPVLLSPSDGAALQDLHVELGLQAHPDPDDDPILVLVELDQTRDFSGPALLRWEDLQPGPEGNLRLDAGRQPDNTRFWWRARSSDGLNEGAWAGASFRTNVANEPPGAPTPVAPEHRAEVATGSPELVVSPAVDPDLESVWHRFEVAADPDFQDLLAESPDLRWDPADAGEEAPAAAATASWTVTPALAVGGPYYWRCRGRDALRAAGPWSPTRRLAVRSADTPPAGVDGGGDVPDAGGGSSADSNPGSPGRGCSCSQPGAGAASSLLSLLALVSLLVALAALGRLRHDQGHGLG